MIDSPLPKSLKSRWIEGEERKPILMEPIALQSPAARELPMMSRPASFATARPMESARTSRRERRRGGSTLMVLAEEATVAGD